MGEQQTYSIDQIKDMLLAQLDGVVDRFAPHASGSYTAFGKFFTLNPGRADRHVGSFYVQMTGAKSGKWADFATGEFGDVLDLIALSLGCDLRGALCEARAYLGLQTASPEDIARRKQAAASAADRRRLADVREKEARKRRAGRAQRIFLSGQEHLRGTPVDRYLAGARGIDLAQLGRQPRVLRYVPECGYYHEDEKTGEVTEATFPAMVAAIYLGDRFTAVHRTYLAIDAAGRWDKAPVPDAKKVLGDYAGGAINLWRGDGPRGGKPASLMQCKPGTHVWIAEGIEDALSVVLLMPEVRVLAAISLSNLGQVHLPDNVSVVTLVADRDENATARAQLDRAIETHRAAGREVRIWKNQTGGKDLNDALRSAQAWDQIQSPDRGMMVTAQGKKAG